MVSDGKLLRPQQSLRCSLWSLFDHNRAAQLLADCLWYPGRSSAPPHHDNASCAGIQACKQEVGRLRRMSFNTARLQQRLSAEHPTR